MLTDLSATPIAEPLRRLAASHSSGDLQVQSGRAVKTIFFDGGRAIFAASNLKKDRLGESLVAQGRITQEEFRQAEALLKEGRRKRVGEALVEAGVLQKSEIGRMLSRQVNRIIASTFEFTEGVATFEERKTSIPLEYMVSLSLPRILYDGIKGMESQDLVLAGLGDLDRRREAERDGALRLRSRRIAPRWRRTSSSARSAGPACATSRGQEGGLDFERLRVLYALVASGVLVEADAAEEAQPVIQMETGTFLLSALQRQPDPTAREAVRQEIRDELERSAQARPRGMAEGLPLRAARGADPGHRGQDGALPRAPRRARRRRPAHRPRGHPRPGVRAAAAGEAVAGGSRRAPRGARRRPPPPPPAAPEPPAARADAPRRARRPPWTSSSCRPRWR